MPQPRRLHPARSRATGPPPNWLSSASDAAS
jgi:hypothetical protein